jgi:hypothetical protein
MLLLRAVREVAESGDGEEPATISQRRWEVARDRHATWSDAPPARRIAQRLGLPWMKVLEAAFSTTRSQEVVLSQMSRNRDEDGWMTEDYCAFALRLIARRLKLDTLRVHEYRAERERLLAQDARRWLHGRQLRLPTTEQVQVVFPTWAAALDFAGLSPASAAPVHRAPTIIELLNRCYEVYGTQPTKRGRGAGIPFPFRTERWLVSVAEWKETLRERELPVPDGVPPKGQRPVYGDHVGAALAGERLRQSWGDRAACVEWVARYLRELEARQRASVANYRDWRRLNLRAPTYRTLHAHGRWTAVRRDAEQAIADGG